MPRPLRVDYAGAIQHVAVNGNNRQPMFLDVRDRYLCLTLLGETAERYGWDVLSYCLMDTHWHLLVRTPEPTLSGGMQRMNTCYSQEFNRRHGRSGHSIRHRFMSVVVEDEAHLFELTRYLPLNPVRGGLIRHPEAWIWSSYLAELGVIPAPAWLHARWSVELHGTHGHLRRFVAAGMAEPGAQWTPGSDPTLTPPRPEE
jgi:REP-associated tyrosine transposase